MNDHTISQNEKISIIKRNKYYHSQDYHSSQCVRITFLGTQALIPNEGTKGDRMSHRKGSNFNLLLMGVFNKTHRIQKVQCNITQPNIARVLSSQINKI